jgi:hypothetical protein
MLDINLANDSEVPTLLMGVGDHICIWQQCVAHVIKLQILGLSHCGTAIAGTGPR